MSKVKIAHSGDLKIQMEAFGRRLVRPLRRLKPLDDSEAEFDAVTLDIP